MPISMPPLEKIVKIHNRIMRRKPHVATKAELMNNCQVAERTLKGYITYMRDVLDAPIFYNRKEKGWLYTEKYDISQHLGFSEKQFNRLCLGLEILDRYNRVPLIDKKELNKIHTKLQITESNPYSKYIYFEQVPYYKGAELIGFFLQAIEEQRIVQFQYESFKIPGLNKRIVHPYILKEREERWYLIGELPEFDGILATYALDRIKQNEHLKIFEEGFHRDSSFDIDKIFKNTYGMTVLNQPVEEVVLLFTPLQARYFQSKPFYPFTVIDQSAEGLMVKMEVIPNWEFIHKLMSLGDGVKILKPSTLAKRLKKEFQNALSMYF